MSVPQLNNVVVQAGQDHQFTVHAITLRLEVGQYCYHQRGRVGLNPKWLLRSANTFFLPIKSLDISLHTNAHLF